MKKIQLNIFNEDFRDFISALQDAKVAYILVGGYSVVLHGYHRTTGDLDIWVQNTEENYNKLIKAFTAFGLPSNAFSLSEFLDNEREDVFTFGIPPVAIDILTKVKGIEFESAFSSSEEINVEGVIVRLIHKNDLLKAKAAAGRYKDLDDLENLKKHV